MNEITGQGIPVLISARLEPQNEHQAGLERRRL
jgi:hypothetical protein